MWKRNFILKLYIETLLILMIFSVQTVLSLKKIVCNLEDEACLTKAGPRQYNDLINGVTSGISSDPLHLDVIETNLPTIKYTLHNATLTGMKDCIVKRSKIIQTELKAIYHIACPHLTIKAEYEASGKLNDKTMEGKGTFTASHENYDITYLGHYERAIDEKKKLHVHLTDVTLDLEAKGKVTYDYKNLFGGDVKKSEEFHRHFSKENWKTVDKILGDATMYVFQLKVIENTNKYFELEPVENIFYIHE